MSFSISPLTPDDAKWVRSAMTREFGSDRVVSRGVLHHAARLPGLKAGPTKAPGGFVLHDIRDAEMEVVTLLALDRGRGVATALMNAARARAREAGCRRMWLITTNDNAPAQRFYERWGMQCVAVHRGAVTQARSLKPEIPAFGVGGIPIEDELEYGIEP